MQLKNAILRAAHEGHPFEELVNQVLPAIARRHGAALVDVFEQVSDTSHTESVATTIDLGPLGTLNIPGPAQAALSHFIGAAEVDAAPAREPSASADFCFYFEPRSHHPERRALLVFEHAHGELCLGDTLRVRRMLPFFAERARSVLWADRLAQRCLAMRPVLTEAVYEGVLTIGEDGAARWTSPELAGMFQHLLAVLFGPGQARNEDRPPPPAAWGLTARELEILRALCSGMRNRDIAHALHISPDTVRTHLRRIFSKLDVSSRTQAIVVAGPHVAGPPPRWVS